MSGRLASAVLEQAGLELTPAQRLVLVAFALHAKHENDPAYPSMQTVAAETGSTCEP
jgi:hypothetical protein